MIFRLAIKKMLWYFINASEYSDKVVVSGFSQGLQNVTFEGKNMVPGRCNFSGNIQIGFASTLGYNNFLHGNIKIGKYCQIGADVAMHATNHPISYMSTYINKNLFGGELLKLKEDKKIRIGNDVWIGHNVLIVGEVTIGNGAILAAGSVVTKDVLPYSIVAGVPAKIVRKRFSEKIIAEIEQLKWWNMNETELQKVRPLFLKDFTSKDSIYE